MWWRRFRYLLALASLCAVATCPAAHRSCVARRDSREAELLLTYLAERVDAQVALTGRVPPLPAGPTPPAGCCEQGGQCPADDSQWTGSGWHALGFSIDTPFFYSYTYTPDPNGKAATLRATGDLDCDGSGGVYELHLEVDGDKVSRAWSRTDPYE
jgi:hypothetical protein